jgi:polysaccharide export outer membrane protein
MRLLRLSTLVLFAIYFSSCGTQKKAPINYIENADSAINGAVQLTEIKIQKNDLLSIQIYSSSLDPSIDAPYNFPSGGGASNASASGSQSNGSTSSASAAPTAGGFLVDENGDIEYPRLGLLHADGLTKSQLAEVIKTKLTTPVKLLDHPSVVIRFMNFKVTVLGEVGHPGPIAVPTGHVTILEALGLAGDIPVSGKKNTVKVLRESEGKRQVGSIDLTSKELFNSPYYNLLQNDVVMVEVTKSKIRQSDQATLQRITTVLGIITSLALVYNIVK